jgi:hypothetical protein
VFYVDSLSGLTILDCTFKIPPDFDDTAVNLGLGTLLKDNIQQFPYASTTWQAQNSNLSSVFNAMKHYAYKPLSVVVSNTYCVVVFIVFALCFMLTVSLD